MTESRQFDTTDRLLSGLQRALATTLGPAPPAVRTDPAAGKTEGVLDDKERQHAAGLMRVNHVGEVCAQALYLGQAALARDPATRAHLLEAADEEGEHLAWCASRLEALNDRPSLLNPLWFAGSFAIGALAALGDDRRSLGFVVETERQVEAHLHEHLKRLPPSDAKSRAVLAQMKEDEAAHAEAATARGAAPLPWPVPTLMTVAANAMRFIAYRV
ncbi:MAG: 2-polyprenyl-3-methyl-6-methoxy-1,4-benzoquinone monooxygenase [Lysobacterales bacterium]